MAVPSRQRRASTGGSPSGCSSRVCSRCSAEFGRPRRTPPRRASAPSPASSPSARRCHARTPSGIERRPAARSGGDRSHVRLMRHRLMHQQRHARAQDETARARLAAAASARISHRDRCGARRHDGRRLLQPGPHRHLSSNRGRLAVHHRKRRKRGSRILLQKISAHEAAEAGVRPRASVGVPARRPSPRAGAVHPAARTRACAFAPHRAAWASTCRDALLVCRLLVRRRTLAGPAGSRRAAAREGAAERLQEACLEPC